MHKQILIDFKYSHLALSNIIIEAFKVLYTW